MGISPEEVLTLMSQGLRQTDIAREYGVTRQYINQLAKQAGYISTMTVISENLPWDVSGEYKTNNIYQSLRLVAHYNIDGDMAFDGSETSLRKMKSLVKKLRVFNQVVDFDPSYPAIPGVVNTEGFAYVPRVAEDEDFIIKIRPGVTITPLGNKIWRLPTDI